MSSRTSELGSHKASFKHRLKYLEETIDRMRRSPMPDREKAQAISKHMEERDAVNWALGMIDLSVRLRVRED
jgi:hypothetical protein